jgi:excisionase family DNA binding protein
MDKTCYGVREGARRLEISLTHFYRLLYESRLPGARKQGGRWVIPAEAIERRLKERDSAGR